MTFLLRPGALGAFAIVAALGLVGCGGDDDGKVAGPAASTSASLTPSAEPTVELSDDIGLGLQPVQGLPSNFPSAEVPLVPGNVVQPTGAGDPEHGWVLEVSSAKGRQACFDEAVAALLARGFELSAGPNVSEQNIEALYLSSGYRVIVTATERDGACSLAYEVATNDPPAPQ